MSAPGTHTVLVTIPDCTASHVLGSTTIPLASGALSLINYFSTLAAPSVSPIDLQATPASTVDSSTPKNPPPVLTLQIGELAFPLMKDTLFGTDAASPRVYLFVPELGPAGQGSQGGHIRLELPAEAQRDADGKGSRSDVFEQALIREGLLKEGWAAVQDEVQRGLRDTVDGIRDKVSGGLATESGRVPPEAIEAD